MSFDMHVLSLWAAILPLSVALSAAGRVYSNLHHVMNKSRGKEWMNEVRPALPFIYNHPPEFIAERAGT